MNDDNKQAMEYGLETLVADLQTKIQDLEKENAELKARLEKSEDLQCRYLEILKLFADASICYEKIRDFTTTRIGANKYTADLFPKNPTVKPPTFDFRSLSTLAKTQEEKK